MTTKASIDALRDLCKWATDLRLAYAWASSSGGQAEHWRILPLAKVTRATIGIQFASTEPFVLRRLLNYGDVLRVIADTEGVFHPKAIVGTNGDQARALVGSANFTSAAFGGNTEINILLSGSSNERPVSDIITFVDAQWQQARAFKPDADWIDRYEAVWRTRPKIPRPPKSARPTIRDLTDLHVAWPRFFQLIAAQERRLLSNGYEIHIFDHPDRSYLQEIEECQTAFRRFKRLKAMPLKTRQFVAGYAGGSGYLGRMGGAGNFKNLINERPEELSTPLDSIPSSGSVSESQVLNYLEASIAIYGVNLGTATRLLAVKRPDVFLAINNANLDGIRRIFHVAPGRPRPYVNLLRCIWSMPWWSVPEQAEVEQRRVWRARVALLDAILYS